MAATITLFRPTGEKELKLIQESGFTGFPPRLPDQPIFYPVTNLDYAVQIARDWNTKHGSKLGFVTRFNVRKEFLDGFERKVVGGKEHEEYWVPADMLGAFNENIVGLIEVIAEFTEADRRAFVKKVNNNA